MKGNYPKGLWYIIGNEAAERFSYYGMIAVLQVFMTEYMLDNSGELAVLSENEASQYVHLFKMGVYIFPLFGAIVSDVFLGKYKTIILLSVVYCLGHIALAIDDTFWGLSLGLALLAVGAGGIKSSTSAHVGDQFTESNSHLMGKVYDYFYMSINVGASISMLLTPWLLKNYGAHLAFGVPGLLMLVATVLFYVGRNKFIALPPVGWQRFRDEVVNRENLLALGKITILFMFFLPFFWALFDQTGSTWITQMKKMDNEFDLLGYHVELLPSQLQSFNPIYILILAPFFSTVVYPKVSWSSIDKIVIGFFVGGASFVLLAVVEHYLEAGYQVSFIYQAIAYLLLTASEVMVSITILEYSYRNSPQAMKSIVMGLYYLSVFIGNFIVLAVLKGINSIPLMSELLIGEGQFYLFAALIFVAGLVLFAIRKNYH